MIRNGMLTIIVIILISIATITAGVCHFMWWKGYRTGYTESLVRQEAGLPHLYELKLQEDLTLRWEPTGEQRK